MTRTTNIKKLVAGKPINHFANVSKKVDAKMARPDNLERLI